MRISKGALLIVIAFIAPLIVELRTVLAWVNVELTVLESVVLGIGLIGVILVWALWPQSQSNGTESAETK
ncbi:CbaC protein [Natrialba sp. SSL1]|uniref:CbaC protein n=1 Tax=Natrialba sp. SSL1 TaxID=1869245 RepID=UPI0008F91261|nr:CbaC protein [Natrialba sp. SSL1]OIB58962.1 CbaC protein [Natrialba sp. SSL1]